MELTSTQITGLNKAGKQYGLETGDTLARLVQEDILDPLYGSSIGATATAAEIDAVAKNGGAAAAGTHVGLNFAYGEFRFLDGYSMVTVAASTIALSSSATNYVQCSRAGTVNANTSGFTAGQIPLYVVTTGVSSVATVVNRKPLVTLIGDDGVNGLMLSNAAGRKAVPLPVPLIATAAGSTYVLIPVPTEIAAGSEITKARVTFHGDDLAASDTNYLTFKLTNLGAGGAGTQVLVDDATAANSTKATGGSAIADGAGRNLTLVTVSGGTERDVTGGDTLLLEIEVTGTLANTLPRGVVIVEFSHDN